MDNGRLRDSSIDGKGRVYVVGCQVGCKIGWTSKDPRDRVRALQTGSPHHLHLVGSVEGTRAVEAAAHQRFSDYRMAGEWFQVNPFDALTWLMYDVDIYRRRPTRKFRPAGCVHSLIEALDVYGHGRSAVWTMDGINAAIGRWPSDDELDGLLYEKRLFRATVRIGERTAYVYSLESFGEDGDRFELNNPSDA
jgi:hypothetical protein